MTKADKILISVIVIISILGIIGPLYFSSNLENKDIVIKVEGKVVKRIAINPSTKGKYTFDFRDEVGSIEVKKGAVRMEKMDKDICPRSICSDRGWIEKNYENIVCLPNKIVLTIEENKDNTVDLISIKGGENNV